MDLFEEFLRHPDIVQQPKGGDGEAKAWCPAHPDREGGNPSLGINTKKGIVHCFVCGFGGAKELAKAWGITEDKPSGEQEIERTYDYHRADGSLAFQVVRMKVPPGSGKKFVQRRPNPDAASGWTWNRKGVDSELYHLPELRAAGPDERVWIVEGEKDVDRLRGLGLVATTNPGGASTGNGKWMARYNKEFRKRLVAILPDNDTPGTAHAVNVATSIYPRAREVKIVHLPDLPNKGDVSDWLDAGHTVNELRELLAQALAFEPEVLEDQDESDEDTRMAWAVTPFRFDVLKVIENLKGHGFFVNGGPAGAYFFDQSTKNLVPLDNDDISFLALMVDRYHIYPKDALFGRLHVHMKVEAYQRAEPAVLRMFSYYDEKADVVYLDMLGGRVLKITADTISVRDNGEDGVLFRPAPGAEPWEYVSNPRNNILYDTIVGPANFTEEGSLPVQHQKLLFLLWLLSHGYESLMMFRPIALAVGPGESGKSSLFRYAGRALYGKEFDVLALTQDKGEEPFWVAVTNSPFVVWDNVDQYIRWLPDALAAAVTGISQPKRQLHTTNQMATYKSRCMLAVTARTPTISLRREDVAGRTLIFSLHTIHEKRPEHLIHQQIAETRGELMSDYARLLQKSLKVPWESVKVSDPTLRLADFVRIATRIGMGLSERSAALTDQVISGLRATQSGFATEEDLVAYLLSIWIARYGPDEGRMDVGPVPNNGRHVTTLELLEELTTIAQEFDRKFPFDTPEKMGLWLKNMRQSLSEDYDIDKGRRKRGHYWTFRVRGAESLEDGGELHESEFPRNEI